LANEAQIRQAANAAANSAAKRGAAGRRGGMAFSWWSNPSAFSLQNHAGNELALIIVAAGGDCKQCGG